MGNQDLALVFATISRPHVAQRLIASVRRYFPDMPIYVADQSPRSKEQVEFYQNNNCSVAWMEKDAGVCASRNAAVDLVKEPFFVLCDDDFILGPDTSFEPALKVLSNEHDVGVVGGRLIDIHQVDGEVYSENRFWELFLNYDAKNGKLVATPVHYFAPEPKTIDGIRYFECDAVMNFAVFRTSMFSSEIRWDPLFKSNGEHEDFYLNLKMKGHWRVVYTPEIVARHHHPAQKSYSKLRNRSVGWELFLNKWGLNQYLEIGHGLLVKNATGKNRAPEMGYQNYYSAAALETQKKMVPQNHLLISDVNNEVCPTSVDTDASPGKKYILSANLKIDQKGTVNAQGGEWRLDPVVANNMAPNDDDDSVVTPGAIVADVSRPTKMDGDILIYFKPRFRGEQTDAADSSATNNFNVFYSLIYKGEYLSYLREALILNQRILMDVPNAILINLPAQDLDDIGVELTMVCNDEVVFEHSAQLDSPTQMQNDVSVMFKPAISQKQVSVPLPPLDAEERLVS